MKNKTDLIRSSQVKCCPSCLTSSYTLGRTLLTWNRRATLVKKVGNPVLMFSTQITKYLKTNTLNSKSDTKKISSFFEVIATKADQAKKLLREVPLKATVSRTFFNKPSISY